LDFRQLRYALSVYKERSFTKAAKRLNISQSAVSEQVKLLEEEIGFELFRRTSRGIEATDRGRTFLYESERVIGDLLSLSDTARRLRGAPLDTLTIGMGSGMAQIFIPRMFADLKNNLPGVRQLSREFMTRYAPSGWDEVMPLSGLIASARKRTARDDVSLFKAMGMGISDLALGVELLKRARERGAGRAIPQPKKTKPRLAGAKAKSPV